MSKKKKDIFRPSNSIENESVLDNNYSKEDIELVTKIAREEYAKEQKKSLTKLQLLGVIWTFITTGYLIATTISFIIEGWIESTVMYVIVGALAVYLCVFVVLIALSIKDARQAKGKIKTYKKLLGIFKAVSNIALLTVGATTMAGLAQSAINKPSLVEWLMFGVTFFVAVVQCAIKLATFITSATARSLAKRYKVRVVEFKGGKRQKNSMRDKMTERKYK